MMRQHKDNEGRIICVEAKINGIKIHFLQYIQYREEPSFFYRINKMLGDISDGHLIIAGDFNQEQDGVLDKTSPTSNVPKF